MNDLLNRVEVLMCTRFGVTEGEFHADAVLADLDLDSLTLVEFGLVVEKEFGIRFGADEITPNNTVADLVQAISSKGLAA